MESVEGPSTWVHCSRPSACQAHEYYYYYPQYDREIHHEKRNLPRSQMATFADEVFPDKLQSRSVTPSRYFLTNYLMVIQKYYLLN